MTDVTYIKDCRGNTSYYSPIKDSVSGLILSSAVSDTQDLNLTDEMLSGIMKDQDQNTVCSTGMVFHSDQGAPCHGVETAGITHPWNPSSGI